MGTLDMVQQAMELEWELELEEVVTPNILKRQPPQPQGAIKEGIKEVTKEEFKGGTNKATTLDTKEDTTLDMEQGHTPRPPEWSEM